MPHGIICRAAGDRVGGISCVSPSVTTTGLESNVIVAGCKPSRLAVNLIVPGIRVERMATAVDAVLGVEVEVVGGVGSCRSYSRRARWRGRG